MIYLVGPVRHSPLSSIPHGSQATLIPKDNRPLSGRTCGKKARQHRRRGKRGADSSDTEKPREKNKKKKNRRTEEGGYRLQSGLS